MPANALSTIKSHTPSSVAEPLTAFRFTLRVEALYVLPCRAVKGLQRENEFEYIQEGGLNDYVHLKRKPTSKPFTFQVERYVGTDSGIAFLGGVSDPIGLGTELVLPVILSVDTAAGKQVRTYVFTGCTVIGKNYGELNAESSALLVETTTIAYREMICVDIARTFKPTALSADVVYKGKSHKDEYYDKKGKQLKAKPGFKDLKTPNEKAGMQAKADKSRWDIKKPTLNRHMKEIDTQKAEVRLWPKTRSARDITAFLKSSSQKESSQKKK